MNKKIIFLISSFVCFTVIFAPLMFAKQGNHFGEQRMLDVNIQFSGQSGITVTNASGTFYYFYGIVAEEDKVYPPKYWGTFPLYFFGERVPVTVRVTNIGPRAKAKIRIKTQAYVLQTNGFSGVPLSGEIITDVEVGKGETRIIDASFTTQWTPAADSGLDRFTVKVLHMNEGGGKGNPEPGLIMVKEGVFCPPKYIPKK